MALYLATHAPIADDSRHCTQFTNARRKGSARSTQRAFIAIALSFAVLTAPLSQAAEPSLTLAEALRLAATDSRQLVAQDAAVTAVPVNGPTRYSSLASTICPLMGQIACASARTS